MIGLATNVTLDAQSPQYKWVDEGEVLASQPGDDWNAIDPNLAFDEHHQPWLAFGSYWSGIKLRKLDLATGKLADRLGLGPAIVIVAGLTTAYLAIVTSDGLVDDDYYKQGLTVNERASHDRRRQAFDRAGDIAEDTDLDVRGERGRGGEHRCRGQANESIGFDHDVPL